jgi:TetR/AcrR family transcriptional regulator, repressor for neighboring sulfatase
MSIKSSAPIERRRKPDAVREEALAIGRRLLAQGGPGAITLKAIGAEMGMSHANLIHHFGSAEAFQDQLKSTLVQELTETATALVRRYRAGQARIADIVDMVFAAYSSGGIGTLVAWSALTKRGHEDHGLDEAILELVTVLQEVMAGPQASNRARAAVCLVTFMALGNSLLGKSLAKTMGSDRDEMRDLTVRILEQFHVACG